jgi:hypothetical protein
MKPMKHLKFIQPIIILLLIVIVCFQWLRKDNPTKREYELERERTALLSIIERKDVLIKRSEEREKAFIAHYIAQEATRKQDSTKASEAIKWYRGALKQRTGIVSDATYDSILSSLYPQ